MSKIPCYIVRDLLPLYIENTCNGQTEKDVEAHLQSCKECEKLYKKMRSDIYFVLHTPEFESDKIFHHAQKSILGIIIALAATISCFVMNISSAWEGGPAEIGNFIITIFYIIFWSVFSFSSRKYEPLAKTSFVISLITFISSIAGLIARISNRGGFITALLSIFSSIPFYGFRIFLDWTDVYAIAIVISTSWLVYTWYIRRKLKHI